MSTVTATSKPLDGKGGVSPHLVPQREHLWALSQWASLMKACQEGNHTSGDSTGK